MNFYEDFAGGRDGIAYLTPLERYIEAVGIVHDRMHAHLQRAGLDGTAR